MCGSQTQRTAAEAWDYMRIQGKLRGLHIGGWWAPVREAMWNFAGAEVDDPSSSSESDEPKTINSNVDSSTPTVPNINPEAQKQLALPQKIVITYIDRQKAPSRNLVESDHSGLIEAIQELVVRKNRERKGIWDQDENDVMVMPEKRQEFDRLHTPLEWEFNVMQAEKLTKDEQVRAAARTTVCLFFFCTFVFFVLSLLPC